MAALTSTDDLIAGLRAPQGIMKFLPVLSVGNWGSCWTTNGQPGAGATPATGSGTACNSLTPGALPLPALSSGQDMYLAALDLTVGQGCTIMLADRLVATSGLSGTLTTAQTVNTLPLDARWADAVGVMLTLEVYSALGATGVTATVTYTNQAGVSGKTTTVAVPASAPIGRVVFVPLAAGDSGVQSVQSVTLSASTGTAGNFGVTLLRPVATLSPPLGNIGASKDFAALGLPDVGSAAASSACLFLLMLASSTASSGVAGSYSVAVK